MGHLPISPMEYPVVSGSTLAAIVERFELGPDTEEARMAWWREFAKLGLEREEENAGSGSVNKLGPLHELGCEAVVAYTGACLHSAWENHIKRPKRKRGIDPILRLFVLFLATEERRLYPKAKNNRIFRHLSQLLGPEIEPQTIRQAYEKGLAFYVNVVGQSDEDALKALENLQQVLFHDFWYEHQRSEKYREDRAFCQNLPARDFWGNF